MKWEITLFFASCSLKLSINNYNKCDLYSAMKMNLFWERDLVEIESITLDGFFDVGVNSAHCIAKFKLPRSIEKVEKIEIVSWFKFSVLFLKILTYYFPVR